MPVVPSAAPCPKGFLYGDIVNGPGELLDPCTLKTSAFPEAVCYECGRKLAPGEGWLTPPKDDQ